jgi:threonine/homoserine/homoserine lactone efflux protein
MDRPFLTGLALGWSVAWPPGPINAEATRRGLAHGFWAAYIVVLGGCAGDATWAVLATVAAGHLRGPCVQWILGVTCVVLLLALSGLFFRGAWRAWRNSSPPAPARLGSSFIVGLTLALTSPWSIAFWIAVVGQTRGSARSLQSSLLFAAAVVAGAAAWGVILSAVVGGLRRRLEGRKWEIATQLLTGCVMIAFAIRTASAVLAHRW